MQYKWVIAAGTTFVGWALNHVPFVRVLIKRTIFAQFCGGENIDECMPVIDKMAKHGVGSILDYSKENNGDPNQIHNTIQEIIKTIQSATSFREAIPFCVFKVSALGSSELLRKRYENLLTPEEEIEYGEIRNRVAIICQEAFQSSIKIMVDAEESWIQHSIDQMVTEMMVQFNKKDAVVFATYQMYLKDKFDQLQKDVNKAKKEGYFLGVKLVRGAYMEKERERSIHLQYPSPIFEDKASCDDIYDKALDYCVAHKEVILLAGTHNEESCAHLVELIQQDEQERKGKVWFSQLYGMGDHISFTLAKAGFKVAKYLPYGVVEDAIPYLFRRAEENKSVEGHQSREFQMLKKYFNH